MIRQLTEEDKDTVLQFVTKQAAENLFIIGDIEAFGFADPVTIWGDFDQQGILMAVLLRYFGNFIAYAQNVDLLDGKAWAEVINHDGRMKRFSGLEPIVRRIIPYLWQLQREKKECYYAKRSLEVPLNKQGLHREVRMLFPEEADRIVRFRETIPEFSENVEDPRLVQRNMEKGLSRSFYIEKNNEPVCAVSTAAETRTAAMIVGVCTRPDCEKQGFATSCLTKLIAVLTAERKEPCLFYDNPAAGRIYKKLGFVDIGRWTMTSYG
ncbi:MAG: GNAT family N-acetyltransferase [Sporolactobacillus sp.]